MHRVNASYERAMAPRKQMLFGNLGGVVLEIGPGTGVNLGFYDSQARWIGIEPNPHMHPYLRHKAAERGFHVELRSGHAERLDVEDSSVDAVVGTLVLCSVKNVPAALREVRRVLKPGGRFYFIEHVGAPAGTRLRKIQRWLRPCFQFWADGCCPDRDTGDAILAAGFADVKLEYFRAPAPVSIMAPHIAGVATKG